MINKKTLYLWFSIILSWLILPSFCKASYDYVLYYKQIGKYKLLIAFPKNDPDSAKGVLFSDNDWHLPRYSDSQEIKDFYSALGFKNRDSRVKLRQKFQSDAVLDKFTSWNWQALFDWLSDMKIEEIAGTRMLIKELSTMEYDSLDMAYKNNEYFPIFTNLKDYLPKLEVEVSNIKTRSVEFGEVEIGAQKKIQVLLKAKNINNATLFINPIYDDYIDRSVTINKLNKPLYLFNGLPDTLEMVFSPPDSIGESIFWQHDTLAFILPLKGDYLPEQVNLFITGVRKKRINQVEYFLAKNLYYISISLICVIIIIGLLLWLYRKFHYQKRLLNKAIEIPRINFNVNKYIEATSFKPSTLDRFSNQFKKKLRVDSARIKSPLRQVKQYWLKFQNKNKLSNEDESLITNIKRLYYYENAEIQRFIKVIQNYFAHDKDQNKKLFDSQFIENQKIKEKDQIISKLQWYKEFFLSLKEISGHKNLDDSVVKKLLIEKVRFTPPREVYSTIEKYCYSPIMANYEKFSDLHKPITENIDIFQKNKEHLWHQKRQVEELIINNAEQKYFIEGVKQGYINIKIQADDLENIQIEYGQFLSIQKLFNNLADNFSLFLKTISDQFTNIDRGNISEFWLKIIDNILVGKSGLAGITGCLERLQSFRNPLIIIKFLEINSEQDSKNLDEENIKSKFRDKLILASYCMPYLQDLRRLFLYLENEELRFRADEKLFSIVKLLNDSLIEILEYYHIYLHQIKLFTRFNQQHNLLTKEQNGSSSYLEQVEIIRKKFKQLVSEGKLADNYVYDINSIGYDIVYDGKNQAGKSKSSQLFVFNKLINNL